MLSPLYSLPSGSRNIVTQEWVDCNMGVASLEKDGFWSYAPDFGQPQFHELRPNGVLRSSEHVKRC
jgi:VCBS repeat-containing protein